MKRLALTTIIAALCAIVTWAKGPNLACEKLFERKEVHTKGHSYACFQQPGNYYRCVTADADKKLMNDALKCLAIDRQRAQMVIEGNRNGEDTMILNIMHNGYVINVGCRWNKETGYLNLFVQSYPEAFQ